MEPRCWGSEKDEHAVKPRAQQSPLLGLRWHFSKTLERFNSGSKAREHTSRRPARFCRCQSQGALVEHPPAAHPWVPLLRAEVCRVRSGAGPSLTCAVQRAHWEAQREQRKNTQRYLWTRAASAGSSRPSADQRPRHGSVLAAAITDAYCSPAPSAAHLPAALRVHRAPRMRPYGRGFPRAGRAPSRHASPSSLAGSQES